MSAWRTALAMFFACALLASVVLAFAARNPVPVQLAIFSALGLICALWERGRYRTRVLAAPALQETGERFFDPVSGAKTTVFYDPATGAREYRT